MLSVRPGVLVRDKAIALELENVATSKWMKGILAFMFGEFIFRSPSPFEDFSLPRKILANSKILCP
jgi:hypothetical protein